MTSKVIRFGAIKHKVNWSVLDSQVVSCGQIVQTSLVGTSNTRVMLFISQCSRFLFQCFSLWNFCQRFCENIAEIDFQVRNERVVDVIANES